MFSFVDHGVESAHFIADLEIQIRESRGENILHQRTIENISQRMQEGNEVRTYGIMLFFILTLYFFVEVSNCLLERSIMIFISMIIMFLMMIIIILIIITMITTTIMIIIVMMIIIVLRIRMIIIIMMIITII